MFLGALAAVLTAGIVLLPSELRQAPTYQQLVTLAPLGVWAAAWGVSAALCWAQAFMRQDRLAFALTTGMWWAYGIAHIVGAFTGVNPRGWFLGLVWLAFGGWVNVIATWPESPPPLPKGVRHAEAVITADRTGVIRSWSTGAEQLLGWSADEVIGQSVDVIIPAELREAHRLAMEAAERRGSLSVPGRRVLDTFAVRRDGLVIPVETTLGMVVTPAGAAFSAVVRRRAVGG